MLALVVLRVVVFVVVYAISTWNHNTTVNSSLSSVSTMASHRDGGDVVNHNFHDFQETISSVENLFQRPLQEVTDQIVNIHKVLVAYDNAAFTFLCYW